MRWWCDTCIEMQFLDPQFCSWMGAKGRSRQGNGYFHQGCFYWLNKAAGYSGLLSCYYLVPQKTGKCCLLKHWERRPKEDHRHRKALKRPGEAWNILGAPSLVQITWSSIRIMPPKFLWTLCFSELRKVRRSLCSNLTSWPTEQWEVRQSEKSWALKNSNFTGIKE